MRISRSVLSWLLMIAMTAAVAYWLHANGQLLQSVESIRWQRATLLVPLVLVSVLIIGLSNQLVASYLGAPLKFSEWLSLAFASTFANHFLPFKAGMALRAAYYKIYCDLSLSHFFCLALLLQLLLLVASSLIGIGSYSLAVTAGGVHHPEVFLFFCLVLVGCGLVILGRIFTVPQRFQCLSDIAKSVMQGWELCRESPSLLWRSLILGALLVLVFAVRLYVAFWVVDQDVAVLGCVFLAAVVAVSGIVAITPASLGIQEAAIVVGSLALGVSPTIALLAGIVDRLASVAVVAVAGSYSLHKVNASIGRR